MSKPAQICIDSSSCAGNANPAIPTTQLGDPRSEPEYERGTLTQEAIPDFKIVFALLGSDSYFHRGGLTEQSHSAVEAARELTGPPTERKKHEDGT